MTDQKKHLSYTFYRISIALAVFLAFFLHLNIGQNILRLLALVMMSSIRDLTGSYTPGYVVCVVLSLVALLCFVGIRQRYSDAKN